MANSDAIEYFVIPLSVQKEGEIYMVGNADLQEFYQFPEEGLRILDMLRAGETSRSIKASFAREQEEAIDVDDFIETLKQVGFIYPADEKARHQEKLDLAEDKDKRLVFKAGGQLAKILFSPVLLVCYFCIVCYAFYWMVQDAALRPNMHAFYFEKNMTLSMLTVLVLFLLIVLMHELGHMLAASRRGVSARLGIGNRMWYIVAESDITGIFSLPRNQRYFPLLAGMLVDVVNIALLTILIKLLMEHGASGYIEQVVQVLIMQIIFNLLWQFNIFMKTDIYYVICNYLSHPDLDREARAYLRNALYGLSCGRFGAPAIAPIRGNIHVLRTFVAIWLVGRVLSIGFLLVVFLPTIYRYAARAYGLYQDPAAGIGAACDLALFALMSMTTVSVGMYMWFRQRRHVEQTV